MTMQHRRNGISGEPIVIRPYAEFKQEKAIKSSRIKIDYLGMASKRITDENPDLAGWFCLQVMTGREKAVEKSLDDAGIRAVVPKYCDEEIRRRGRVLPAVFRPIIRGYVFVHCVPSPAAFLGMMQVDHVIGIVGSAYRAYKFGNRQITEFIERATADAMRWEPTLAASFRPGMQAKVIDGPFASFIALIVERKGTEEGEGETAVEIPVEVNIFGRSTPVMMPLAFLEHV